MQNRKRPDHATALLRKVHLMPYGFRKPSFAVAIWETDDTSDDALNGKPALAYRLSIADDNGTRRVLFEGADFRGSPMHAIDSNATLVALMGFLCLRPGDTDRDYTRAQLEFCDQHAESLGLYVQDRYASQ